MGCGASTEEGVEKKALSVAVVSGESHSSGVSNADDVVVPRDPNLSHGTLIGCGAFSQVFLAYDSASRQNVAVKIGYRHTSSGRALKAEAKILRRLAHPNIVQFYKMKKFGQHCYLYIEYMSCGSVKKALSGLALTEAAVAFVVRETLKALEYLHSLRVIHCDVKGSNILVNSSGMVKLCDFGSAIDAADDTAGSIAHSDTGLRGTSYWMAPEVVRHAIFTTAADIWGIGCTAIELLTGHPPFWTEGTLSAMVRIGELCDTEGVPVPPCSDLLKDFLKNHALVVDYRRRAAAQELLRHPWISACERCPFEDKRT